MERADVRGTASKLAGSASQEDLERVFNWRTRAASCLSGKFLARGDRCSRAVKEGGLCGITFGSHVSILNVRS